jgi:hypothetical protein
MPIMTRLRDIAAILGGLTPGATRGDACKFAQMRELVWSDCPLLQGERPTAGRARPVGAADVLLAARGERSVAVRPRDDMIGAFVTLDVYLIKPDVRRLDPDYLAAFLARPDVGMQLRLSTAGASLPLKCTPFRPDIVLFVNGIPFTVIEVKHVREKVEQGISQQLATRNRTSARPTCSSRCSS